MKKLFFILVLTIGLMSFTSSNEVKENLVVKKQGVELTIVAENAIIVGKKCYNIVYDPDGTPHLVAVKCPDIIIIQQ